MHKFKMRAKKSISLRRLQTSPITNRQSDSESVEEPEPEPSMHKTVSAPAPPVQAESLEIKVKSQISAPSYFHSLASNDLPPFKVPDKEPRPMILTSSNQLITTEDIIEMVASFEDDPDNGLQKFLGSLLVEKTIIQSYDLNEKRFLIDFLTETMNYAASHNFKAHKLAVLFTIYLTTHVYFKWFYWSPPIAIWEYFKELMIRHTIENTPDGVEVFEPEECYDIVSHFHNIYISNLPLIHILTFGSYRLNLGWPFKPPGKRG